MSKQLIAWRATSIFAALIGYGALVVFLWMVGTQIYRWFRDGEWPHLGINEGMRVGLNICCAQASPTGVAAQVLGWIEAPVNWLGLHRVLELVPASLALFAVSIFGNCLFIYCRDKLRPEARPNQGDAA